MCKGGPGSRGFSRSDDLPKALPRNTPRDFDVAISRDIHQNPFVQGPLQILQQNVMPSAVLHCARFCPCGVDNAQEQIHEPPEPGFVVEYAARTLAIMQLCAVKVKVGLLYLPGECKNVSVQGESGLHNAAILTITMHSGTLKHLLQALILPQ
jgi:hypothetical protein